MKTVFLSGRLTADPDVRTVGESGTRLATFSIANNETDKESGEFYDVRCWWTNRNRFVGRKFLFGNGVTVSSVVM